jgi:hypothetical protein
MTEIVKLGGVPLSPGKIITVVQADNFLAGTRSYTFTSDSDAVLFSLWVDSVPTGSLSVTIYTFTENSKEVSVLAFPTITASTTELLLRKTAVSLSNLRVEIALTTGTASLEVRARGLTAGESTAKISGQTTWTVTQASITTAPSSLVPASLVDRNGLVIKNAGSNSIYLGETVVNATPALGWPLSPGESLAMDLGAGQSIYASTQAGTSDARIAQAGA